MQDLKTIKERHKLVKKSKLPSRLVGESATDKFMAEVRSIVNKNIGISIKYVIYVPILG